MRSTGRIISSISRTPGDESLPHLNNDKARALLRVADFHPLFIELLGWEHHTQRLDITVDGKIYSLIAIAHKRGIVAFECVAETGGALPPYPIRRKIDQQATRSAREHIIIYVDSAKTTQIWQWVKREPGKPTACREHAFQKNQPGNALIQKLQAIAFSIEEEETLTLPAVAGRTRQAFDVEKITKKFYERFKTEHDALLKFIKGIPDDEYQRWYASVMLNRLMFIYFIQEKGFLDNNQDYLRKKLVESKERGKDKYYSGFLCPLFFEGFAKKETERSATINKLLGKIPYLNGGLFLKHQIEELHGKTIQIPDSAFEKIFDFFKQYQWHLDERPVRKDDEINPDVLGYIFEKYINQKQMGAYYTKEDITEYISKNTVIPFLFDAAKRECRIAFVGAGPRACPDTGGACPDSENGQSQGGVPTVWQLPQIDPDRYIYNAVKHGMAVNIHENPPKLLDKPLPLPNEIAAGLDDVSKRTEWNRSAPPEYALPTEIWREVVARRKRYEEVREKLAKGEIRDINDFITYNLDIRQFAQDVIETSEGPELLRAFYHAIEKVTVLDPTCGSGAFLFAALNILEPLYEACLDRMQVFLDELDRSGEKHRPEKYSDFKKILAQVEKHPNRRYFILKSIIVNNLYGVDIMEEAIEICKLRLFLKLVAQVGDANKIEPLPDIDFNIRAGNTLVGFATYDEVKKVVTSKLDFENTMDKIEERAREIDGLFKRFHEQQTALGGIVTPEDKQELQKRLKILEDELNQYLAVEYGVDLRKKNNYQKWLDSHKPFHWFIEFYGILNKGGFDVVIGNPPYVEYRLVRNKYMLLPGHYRSEQTGNLYAFCMERSSVLLKASGDFGMIVPAGVLGLDDALSLREVLCIRYNAVFCSTYAIRPSKLFDGVDQRLCIWVGRNDDKQSDNIYSTRYHHWQAEERDNLFPSLQYGTTFLHTRIKRIPQMGNIYAQSIIEKLEAKSLKTVKVYFSEGHSGSLLHYHRSPRYWIRAMDFEQYFKSPTRDRSIHHFRNLYFKDVSACKVIGAMLNSSLFFFWFISVGNGRNITGTDIEEFPIGEIGRNVRIKLPTIFDDLMTDYKANSFVRTRQDCEFQEFRPSKSKIIIDQIDTVLSDHYGFTDTELDFIINYDIKYRMGRDSEQVEDV